MGVEVAGWGQPGLLGSGWLRNSWGYVDRFQMHRGFGEKTKGSGGNLPSLHLEVGGVWMRGGDQGQGQRDPSRW